MFDIKSMQVYILTHKMLENEFNMRNKIIFSIIKYCQYWHYIYYDVDNNQRYHIVDKN